MIRYAVVRLHAVVLTGGRAMDELHDRLVEAVGAAFGEESLIVETSVVPYEVPAPRTECLHRLRDLPREQRPYRYACVICGERLKVANGVRLDELEAIDRRRQVQR